MKEESNIFKGILYTPKDPELKALKLKSHNLCTAFNLTFEDEVDKRSVIINNLFNKIGEDYFIQGPIHIHYGRHIKIGRNFFANFNLTIQDDTWVTIGNNCDFGPNVTIVTPIHPMLPDERRAILDSEGNPQRMCYAKPVHIGNDCWIAADVTICPGVTIGSNCVIGAGSVVTKDIPSNSFAAGNPCRVIREINEQDSMENFSDILGNNTIIK